MSATSIPDNNPWPAWLPIATGVGGMILGKRNPKLGNALTLSSILMDLHSTLNKTKWGNTGWGGSSSPMPMGMGMAPQPQQPEVPEMTLSNIAGLFGVK